MAVEWFMIYVLVQWISSLIVGFSIITDSFAKTQILKMRKVAYICLAVLAILAVFSHYDFFQVSIWGFLIVPLTVGVIIVSILYSTLTSLFVFNTTHELKSRHTHFGKTLSLIFLPIGIFLLKPKKEYASSYGKTNNNQPAHKSKL